MQRVEIELPDPIYRQLARIAEETSQPIAMLAAQSVISNLPPSVEDVLPELRAELLALQTLATEDLLSVAHSEVVSADHVRQVELLEKHEDGQLTEPERQELSTLRQAADRLMLRKAYAWSILRWRGQRVPSLEELPIPQ